MAWLLEPLVDLASICAGYTTAAVGLDRTGVCRAVEVRLMNATEHGILTALVGCAIGIAVAGSVWLACLVYRVHRVSERTEGLTAAASLQAKRAPEQHR